MKYRWNLIFAISFLIASGAAGLLGAGEDDSADAAKSLGVSFSSGADSTLILERDGKRYKVDVAARTIQEIGPAASEPAASEPAAALFQRNCAGCHRADGKGVASLHTPDFTNPALQRSLSAADVTDAIRNGAAGGRMPAWLGKLSETQIDSVATYVRSFSKGGVSSSSGPQEAGKDATIYEPGDDMLFSLPTGRAVDEHGLYVNFTHRFPYDAAFTGEGRGGELFGLDNFGLASFGIRYGVTDKLSVSMFRSPTLVGRPIQLMMAYNILDEHHEDPLNLAVRVSIEGQNNFRKSYTQNIEGIFSRSITSRAQLYVVPTLVVRRPGAGAGDGLHFRGHPGYAGREHFLDRRGGRLRHPADGGVDRGSDSDAVERERTRHPSAGIFVRHSEENIPSCIYLRAHHQPWRHGLSASGDACGIPG